METELGEKCVTILNIKEKQPRFEDWQTEGPMRRAFDRKVQDYVIVSDYISKLSLPGDGEEPLNCMMPFLVFQIKILRK